MMRNVKSRIKKSGFICSKNTLEYTLIFFIFLISFINESFLLLALISSLMLFSQKSVGAIKILNLLTLRTIINPGIAVNISSWQSLKWGIIFLSSTYLVTKYFKMSYNDKNAVNKIIFWGVLYSLYSIISSIFYSSLPVVASFKVISYIYVFLGILIGVNQTRDNFDWNKWMQKLLQPVIVISLFTISTDFAYLRNGYSFQGLTNHPNMFGMIAGLFVSIILFNLINNNVKNKGMSYILIGITIFMVVLCKSRTALITILFAIIVYIMVVKVNKVLKGMIISLSTSVFIFYSVIDNSLIESLIGLIYKGHDNIIYSRVNQFDGLIDNFLRSPIFGSGFAVPVLPFKSYEFSFDFVVEPGNIVLAILSYGGIIGFILFVLYFLSLISFKKNKSKYLIILPITILLINMGEMVYFSTNNIGILIYMFLAIYVANNPKINYKNRKENI